MAKKYIVNCVTKEIEFVEPTQEEISEKASHLNDLQTMIANEERNEKIYVKMHEMAETELIRIGELEAQ